MKKLILMSLVCLALTVALQATAHAGGWGRNRMVIGTGSGGGFIYQRHGNTAFYSNSRGGYGTSIYAPGMRFDTYTSPRYGTRSRTLFFFGF